MARPTQMSVLVPTHFLGDLPAPADFIKWFQAAEELGFSSIWILDRIYSPSKVPDAMTMLAWASAVTSRVRLGTAVLLLPHRHPILLAKEVSTLDYISGGRLDLGIGLGGREIEFHSLGMKLEERLKRFRDNLAAMRAIWSGPDAAFEGRFVNFSNVNIEPRPVQKGNLPIWIGGEADGVLKRTAELADGWIGGARNTPEILADKISKIKAFARERGRDPDSLGYASLEYMTIDEDVEKARARNRGLATSVYGPAFDSDTYTTFGDLNTCVARLQTVVDAGCNEIIISPPDLDIAHLTRLAKEVVPAVKV